MIEGRNKQTTTRVVSRTEFEELKQRVSIMENIMEEIAGINASIKKAGRYVKVWGPVVAAALVSNGLLNERWLGVLKDLFGTG